MQNMDMKVQGNKLTITVDLTQNLGPSASGKSTKVASSEGNVDVPNHPGMKVGLNVYTKE